VWELSSIDLHFLCYFSQDNGGNAGRIKVLVSEVEGIVELRTCGGNGADPARNGQGGQGKNKKKTLTGGLFLYKIIQAVYSIL